eukprot:5437479-Heterocapsa_arctica.AAC.1
MTTLASETARRSDLHTQGQVVGIDDGGTKHRAHPPGDEDTADTTTNDQNANNQEEHTIQNTTLRDADEEDEASETT